MAIIEVDTSNFEQEVLQSKEVVLVDFWAPWCGPCQMLGPIVDTVAEELEDVKVCKVNTDENQDLAVKYNVMSIPTLAVFKDGDISSKTMGLQSKEEIKAWVSQ